ncbi:MAG: Gfo/Idh/MocA family oxidoreductase [Caldilineaceae bacterium]|nr:Gfo/Idh/MocA family oxidoreductase [Caldilineaceae bacterium]
MTTTFSTSLRIGIMSFAHMHAVSYVNCLRQIPGVDVVGICDDDAERGQKWATEFGTGFFADADALLDQGLDAVIICSENVKHRPMVEMAAGRVGAILCEKPIATIVADAQAMIDRCAATGTKLQIAFPVRFSPPIQQLKRTLDAGTLGQIFSAKCTNHGYLPGRWFVQKDLSGGGAVIDHTVHVIDVLRWFWGAEVTEVYAEVGESLVYPDLGIDDAGLLSFKLSNGVYGTLDTSWSRPTSYVTWGDVKIEVLGDKGIVRVDAFGQHLTVASNQVGKTRQVGWGSDMDLGLVTDFVDMIRQDRQPSITGYDGLKAMEVALAAYESARTGQPVRL